MGILSAYVAVKFVQLLARPFKEWDAFKMGLIDAKGKKLRDPKTADERDQFSSWMNLVRNTKRTMAAFPGGSSLLGSIVTAYLLLRDSKETDVSTTEWSDMLREIGIKTPKPLLTERNLPELKPGIIMVRPGLLAETLRERGGGPLIQAVKVIDEGTLLGVQVVTIIDTAGQEIQACRTDLSQG